MIRRMVYLPAALLYVALVQLERHPGAKRLLGALVVVATATAAVFACR